jgi:hypothetical protein
MKIQEQSRWVCVFSCLGIFEALERTMYYLRNSI